jgi:hypothetical protein
MCVNDVTPRKDHRGVDLISDAVQFGRLRYGEPNAISNTTRYAKFYTRSRDAAIRVHDDVGNVIETGETQRRFQTVLKQSSETRRQLLTGPSAFNASTASLAMRASFSVASHRRNGIRGSHIFHIGSFSKIGDSNSDPWRNPISTKICRTSLGFR